MKEALKQKLKILVIRPDKIGDVVLSTPVLQALKHHDPDAEIHVLVQDRVIPVVAHHSAVDQVLAYKPGLEHRGLRGLWRLAREIRRQRYDIAVTLQVNFLVSLAQALAGIRYRIGPYSKWYSYFLFNRGKRQSRSKVEMHESDYNLMLLRRLGIRVPSRRFEPMVVVNADAKDRMRRFVHEAGVEDSTRFVVVHPGMGGSALNWPEGYYVDLIQRIAAKNIPVFMTGSVHEKALIDRVVQEAGNQKMKLPIKVFLGEDTPTGLSDLMGLLSLAHVVVAPSTGPLHLAAALGKQTVSFYSPIKVQSALRWGPYVQDDSRHDVLVPDALCGQDFKCAGRKCHFYFCMERLGVDEAFQKIVSKMESQ